MNHLIPQISKRMGLKDDVHYISGAYTPVTEEGNILVDGVLASCYAFADHDLAHLTMTPIHLFPDIVNIIFGHAKGSPSYVDILEDFGKYLLPCGIVNGLN